MLKRILYKEWIKLRLTTLTLIGIGIAINIYIFFTLRNQITQISAPVMWFMTLFWTIRFHLALKVFSIISGIALGFFQFIPEMINKRIKLSLHVPLSINSIISNFIISGSALLTVVNVIVFGIFMITLRLFYESEICLLILKHVLPWILSGYVTYLTTSSLIIERNWLSKFLILVIGFTFTTILFQDGILGEKDSANVMYLIISISTILLPFYSIWHFKKGI